VHCGTLRGQDSAVSIVTRLLAGLSRLQIPAQTRKSLILPNIQADIVAHPASYSVASRASFVGCKAART